MERGIIERGVRRLTSGRACGSEPTSQRAWEAACTLPNSHKKTGAWAPVFVLRDSITEKR
ncbi:hypothetical protein KAM463_35310 [Aeromonas caviae]|nr:hypothetical protein KAM463_35310 [Aeromonas caviae]